MSRKSIILFSICCLATFLSIIVYFLSDRMSEKAVPAVVTLSSEQLLGLGYTEASPADSRGIWEDENFSYSGNSPETSTASAVSFPLDINAATAEELIQIKGIGSATAEKIIAYRNEHGCFYSLDELVNIDGIGSKKLSEIKDYIYIDPEIASELPEETASAEQFSPETCVDPPESSETEVVTVEKAESESIFPIELNTASAEELMEISGVGETIAEAIVEYAQSVGFNSKSDLMNVPGIGEKRFECITPYVYVDRSAAIHQ